MGAATRYRQLFPYLQMAKEKPKRVPQMMEGNLKSFLTFRGLRRVKCEIWNGHEWELIAAVLPPVWARSVNLSVIPECEHKWQTLSGGGDPAAPSEPEIVCMVCGEVRED